MPDFYDLFKSERPPPPPTNVTPLDPARASKYAAKALEAECAAVGSAPEGQRNDTLNTAAFSLGQLIAAGHLEEADAQAALEQAALSNGLTTTETAATIRSGFRKGAEQPRVVPELPPTDVVDVHALVGAREAQNGHVAPSGPMVAHPPAGDADGATEGDVEPEVATWAPLALDDVLDGTYEPELPSLMPRTDDACLLYPGRIHSFHGESESGKSLVAQAEAARLLEAGRDVLFIDFESDRASVTGRMLELGAGREAIREHFTYVRPEVDPRRFPHEREAVAHLLARRSYAMAVIDGVTESLGIFGYSTKDNDEITTFLRVLPRAVATTTGAATVMIDHVTKDSEGRGRFAIGGQAKMAGLDGAAYVVEVTEALGRGLRGEVTLRVAKDRPGGVRANAGEFRKGDRTQEVARIEVDSTGADGLIRVTVHPHGRRDDRPEFRPTRIMEVVSRACEDSAEPLSGRTLKALVGGNDNARAAAVMILAREHFIRLTDGPRGATLHTSVQPYREISDGLVDPDQETP